MSLFRAPSFETVLQRYRPLWTALYLGVDYALAEAAEKFRNGQHTFDGNVHSGDVRLGIRDYLDRNGPQVESALEGQLEREHVSNCGLWVRYKECSVRVYKSESGQLPVARTKVQRRHYQQPGLAVHTLWSLLQQQEGDIDDIESDFSSLNLVAHWHIMPFPSLRLVNLMLALPNGADNLPFWNEFLPNPATYGAALTEATLFGSDNDIPGVSLLPQEPTGD